MAPEIGDTQLIAPQASSAPATFESRFVGTQAGAGRASNEITIEDAHLPSMADLDGLVGELDLIDATLAELG